MKEQEQTSIKREIISIILIMAVFMFALSYNNEDKITGTMIKVTGMDILEDQKKLYSGDTPLSQEDYKKLYPDRSDAINRITYSTYKNGFPIGKGEYEIWRYLKEDLGYTNIQVSIQGTIQGGKLTTDVTTNVQADGISANLMPGDTFNFIRGGKRGIPAFEVPEWVPPSNSQFGGDIGEEQTITTEDGRDYTIRVNSNFIGDGEEGKEGYVYSNGALIKYDTDKDGILTPAELKIASEDDGCDRCKTAALAALAKHPRGIEALPLEEAIQRIANEREDGLNDVDGYLVVIDIEQTLKDMGRLNVLGIVSELRFTDVIKLLDATKTNTPFHYDIIDIVIENLDNTQVQALIDQVLIDESPDKNIINIIQRALLDNPQPMSTLSPEKIVAMYNLGDEHIQDRVIENLDSTQVQALIVQASTEGGDPDGNIMIIVEEAIRNNPDITTIFTLATNDNEEIRQIVSQIIRNNINIQNMLGISPDQVDEVVDQIQKGEWGGLIAPRGTRIETSEGTFVVGEDGIYKKAPWWQFWKKDEKIDETNENYYTIVHQLNVAGIEPVVVQNRYVGTDTYDLLAPDGAQIQIGDTAYYVDDKEIYESVPFFSSWNPFSRNFWGIDRRIEESDDLDSDYQTTLRDLNFQHQIDNGHGIYQGVDQDNQPALFRVNPDGSVNMQKPDTDNWVATDYDQSTIDSNPNFVRILSPILTEMYTKDGRLFYGDLSSTTVYSRNEDGLSDDWTQEGDITLDQLRFTRDYTRILTAPDDIKTSIGDTNYYVKDGKIYEERFGRDREVTSSDRYYNDIAGQLNEGIDSAPEPPPIQRKGPVEPDETYERPFEDLTPEELKELPDEVLIEHKWTAEEIEDLRKDSLTARDIEDILRDAPIRPLGEAPLEAEQIPVSLSELPTEILTQPTPLEPFKFSPQERDIIIDPRGDDPTVIYRFTGTEWEWKEDVSTSDWQEPRSQEDVNDLFGSETPEASLASLDDPFEIDITNPKLPGDDKPLPSDSTYHVVSSTKIIKRNKETGLDQAYYIRQADGSFTTHYMKDKTGSKDTSIGPSSSHIASFNNALDQWNEIDGLVNNYRDRIDSWITGQSQHQANMQKYQSDLADFTNFEDQLDGVSFLDENDVEITYKKGIGFTYEEDGSQVTASIDTPEGEGLFNQLLASDDVYKIIPTQPLGARTPRRPGDAYGQIPRDILTVLTEGGEPNYDLLSPFNQANLAKFGITKGNYANALTHFDIPLAQDKDTIPKELTLAQRMIVKRQGVNRLISKGEALSKIPTTTAQPIISQQPSEEEESQQAERTWTEVIGFSGDTNGRSYKAFISEDNKVLYIGESAVARYSNLIYSGKGDVIGFIGTDGVFHFHEPEGGWGESIESVGRISRRNEGEGDIPLLSGYDAPPTLFGRRAIETEGTEEVLARIANLVPSWVLGDTGDNPRTIAARLIEYGELEHAAAILESLGDLRNARDLYYREAAETLLELGETEAAAEIYMNLGEYERAAQLFDQFGTGNLPKAAEAYIKAAEELVRLGAEPIDIETMYAMAGIIYFEMGDYKKEAELWTEVARKTTATRSKQYQDSAADAYKRLVKYNVQFGLPYEEAIIAIEELIKNADPSIKQKLIKDKQVMENIAYVYSRYPGWFGKTRVPQIMDSILGNKYVSFLTNEGYPNILGLWFQKRDDKWDTPISDTWNNWLSGPDGIAADRCKGKVAIDDLDGGFATSAKIGGPYVTIEGEKITIINYTDPTPTTFYYYKISIDVYPGTIALGCDLKFQIYLDKDKENKNGNEVHLMKDDAGNDYTWDIRRGDPAVSFKGPDMYVRQSKKEYKRVCIDLKRIIPRGERSCLIGIEEGDQLCSIIKEGETHEFDFKCSICEGWGAKFTTLGLGTIGRGDRERGDTGDGGTPSSSGTSGSDQPGPKINEDI